MTARASLSRGLRWAALGLWVPLLSAQVPVNESVDPSSGSGITQTFGFQTYSSGGYNSVNWVQMIFNPTLTGVNACYLAYARPSNQLLLAPDDGSGWGWSGTPSVPGTIENSQCRIDVGASWISAESLNLMTIHVAVTFKPPLLGDLNSYMITSDSNGTNGWQPMGSWNVPPVINLPVAPSGGSGLGPQVFAFTGASVNGYSSIAWTQIIFNGQLNGVNACYLAYVGASNQILLAPDNGSGWGWSGTPGVAGVMENSQCRVDPGASWVLNTATSLTVNLSIAFKNGLSGSQGIWVNLLDYSGPTTGWQYMGAWSLPAPQQYYLTTAVSPSGGGTISPACPAAAGRQSRSRPRPPAAISSPVSPGV